VWGKIGFAILMGFGVIISVLAGNINMAIFFAIITAIMIWIIRSEKGKGGYIDPRTR
jgi:hypothetical protein